MFTRPQRPFPALARSWMSALMVVVAPALHAQSTTPPPEPPELTAARTALFTQTLADSQRITEQYITALTTRETALAAAGDYEEARRFKVRRDQLTMIFAGFDSTLAETRAIPLPLSSARLTGSTQSNDETLTNWRSTGSGAEWTQFQLPPGSYILQFEASLVAAPVAFATARMLPKDRASFEIAEVTQLLGTGDNRKAFTITESKDDTEFTTMRVGPLSFTRSPLTLRLSSAEGYPANIIRLRNLRFIPIEDTAPKEAAVPDPEEDAAGNLEAVQEALASELLQAQQGITQAYLDRLDALARGHSEWKKQVENEVRHIKQLSAHKEAAPLLSPPTLLSHATIRLEGFEEIHDAKLADGEPQAGDRFNVVHDGKTLLVRLLWLQAPPVEDDSEAAAPLAKHFGIEVEDAVAVGRAARDFTTSYLRGKTLQLLALPGRDSEGAVSVLVYLPDVGLYQNVLIDQGLAAVQPPANPTPDDPAVQALFRALTAREQAARRQRPAVGAWAFTSDRSSK